MNLKVFGLQQFLGDNFVMESINFIENELNEGLRNLVNSVYNSKGRFYHGCNHINSMLQKFEGICENNPEIKEGVDYVAMRLAIIFHDLIQGIKNAEEKSAQIMGSLLQSNFSYYKIEPLILATNYFGNKFEFKLDEGLIRDLDLEGLGASWDVYLHNSFLIRQEYPNISMDEFCKGRKEFIKHILSFEKIYSTPYFEHLEEKARANLKRELEFCDL